MRALLLPLALLPVALAPAAAQDGNDDPVPALRAQGWDFTTHRDANLRLLAQAGSNGGLVAELLLAGVPADSEYGCVALNTALTGQDRAAAETLVEYHAPFVVESAKSYGGRRCDVLGDAVARGDLAGATWMINHGADANEHDAQGTTLLMRAGHALDMVRLLLSRGADFNARDETGQTVLMRSGAWPDLVQVLLERGANQGLKDKNGKTALDIFGAASPAGQLLIAWRQAHPG
jgi:Ankyrin repeats (3 copies)